MKDLTINKDNCIAIIPARYASTRFPGKPLALIQGKSMIQRVVEQAQKSLAHVYVATDDERIAKEVNGFGGQVVLTSASHKSGTDRLAEAIQKIEQQENKHYTIVVNVQGDEPFIQPEQIEQLLHNFTQPDCEISTLIKKIETNEQIWNPNLPKVTYSLSGRALYFSRSPIPYIRNHPKEVWEKHHTFFRHIGMYGYKKEVLLALSKLPASHLEKAESLEQNRWLENGYQIFVKETFTDSIGIDTPEDLARAEDWLK